MKDVDVPALGQPRVGVQREDCVAARLADARDQGGAASTARGRRSHFERECRGDRCDHLHGRVLAAGVNDDDLDARRIDRTRYEATQALAHDSSLIVDGNYD